MIKMRIHNNAGSDYIDYRGETIEDIKEQCKNRIKQPGWDDGWSERLK